MFDAIDFKTGLARIGRVQQLARFGRQWRASSRGASSSLPLSKSVGISICGLMPFECHLLSLWLSDYVSVLESSQSLKALPQLSYRLSELVFDLMLSSFLRHPA